MFSSKKRGDTIHSSMINTIIGNHSKIEGVLTASESTRIDGVLKGKVLSESSVIVGETGTVYGDITAVEILIAGIVYGNLVAEERIEMTSTGRVLGDLITKTLVIDEGASFKGRCTMEVEGEQPPEAELQELHTTKQQAVEEKPQRQEKGEDKKEKDKKEKDIDPDAAS